MANICKNRITAIGLQEGPEVFVKALSKVMFRVDLDHMEPTQWGAAATVDGTKWYDSLVDEFRREGPYAALYCVLYPYEPDPRYGGTIPRFYVETKWKPPYDELLKVSKVFPELTLHLDWWLLQDGPVGEFVLRNGGCIDSIKRNGSWYLFDWPLLYPTTSLLSAHLPWSLAKCGALRVDDAIQTIEGLRRILDEKRFTDSPCQAFRDPAKVEQTRQTLDALLEQMKNAREQLTFDRVFLNDSRCETFYDRRYQKQTRPPTGRVGDYQQRADEVLAAETKQGETSSKARDQ